MAPKSQGPKTRVQRSRPPAKDPAPLHGALVQVMTEMPGEWALVRTYDTRRTANQIVYLLRRPRGSNSLAKPPGEWEFASGPVEDEPGRYGVWARYIGEELDAAAQA